MDAESRHSPTAAERTELHRSELSNAFVHLYKERFGRGPTKVRTDYAGPDIILVTVEDSLTPAERSLAEMGQHQRLRDTRVLFQYATERPFVEAVEQITGRRVRAYVSGIDTENDVSAEVFYLEPDGQVHPTAPG